VRGGLLLTPTVVPSTAQDCGRYVSMVMSIRPILSAKHTMDAGGFSTTNITTSEIGFFQVCVILNNISNFVLGIRTGFDLGKAAFYRLM